MSVTNCTGMLQENNEQAVKEGLKNDGGYYRTEQMGNDDENAAV